MEVPVERSPKIIINSIIMNDTAVIDEKIHAVFFFSAEILFTNKYPKRIIITSPSEISVFLHIMFAVFKTCSLENADVNSNKGIASEFRVDKSNAVRQ